jgi:hypothetical protein
MKKRNLGLARTSTEAFDTLTSGPMPEPVPLESEREHQQLTFPRVLEGAQAGARSYGYVGVTPPAARARRTVTLWKHGGWPLASHFYSTIVRVAADELEAR